MVGVNLIWRASIESSVPLLLLGTALIAFLGFAIVRRTKGAAGPGRHVRGRVR
jgi:hypothetical protein